MVAQAYDSRHSKGHGDIMFSCKTGVDTTYKTKQKKNPTLHSEVCQILP